MELAGAKVSGIVISEGRVYAGVNKIPAGTDYHSGRPKGPEMSLPSSKTACLNFDVPPEVAEWILPTRAASWCPHTGGGVDTVRMSKFFLLFFAAFLFAVVLLAKPGFCETDIYYGMLSKLPIRPAIRFSVHCRGAGAKEVHVGCRRDAFHRSRRPGDDAQAVCTGLPG